MDKTDLAYAAGIIDGEGCISIVRCRRQDVISGYVNALKVSVGMVDDRVVKWLHQRFGGHFRTQRPTETNHKSVFIWLIQATQAQELLIQLLPYLKLKHDQAVLAIDFQSTKSVGRKYGSHSPKPIEAYDVEEKARVLLKSLHQGGEHSE